MDRLSLVGASLVLCCVFSCQDKAPSSSGSSRERVQSVASNQSRAEVAAEFCDVVPNKAFEAPALADGKSFAKSSGWHWINLWATWCEPCIEEMPRLMAWQKKWTASGLDVQLSFLSADEESATIEAFAKQHPEAPPSLRVADLEQVKTWLTSLGSSEMILPVHILVDGQGKVQCIRASSVEDRDERLAKALVQTSP